MVRKSVDRFFETEDLHQGIGKKTARGGLYTLGAAGLNFIVTTVSTVLVTRQLSDEDFGLVAMVTILTGFAGIFLNLGLSQAVVQKKNINHEQVSTLFWINLAIAIFIASIVAASTPILIWIYDEPRLLPINLALSGLFLVSALGLQHRALLARRMEHGKINSVALAATLIAATTAVVIAFLGGGYWALVGMTAATQLVVVIGMWIACPWVPGRPTRGSGVRQMLGYGSTITANQFISYFARKADNALLGYNWGAAPLGLYSRAYSLMMLPAAKINGPLTNVAVPALSRLRDNADKYRLVFLTCLTPLAYFQTLTIGLAVLNIESLVLAFLGKKWLDIIPVFYALAPACVAAGTNVVGGWLYLSYGHVDAQLKWSVFQTLVMLAGLIVGVQFGAVGTAWAVSIVYTLSKPLAIIYASRPTPISAKDILICVYKPIGMTLVVLAITLSALTFINESTLPWVQILIRSTLYAVLTAVLLAVTPWSRKDIKDVMKYAPLLRNETHAKKR